MDRAVRAGVVGGGVTALAGLLGYVVWPLVAGGGGDPVLGAFTAVVERPLWYHLLVLVGPAFVVAFVATWTTHDARTGDRKLLASLVAVPLVAAFLTYVVSALWVGLTSAAGSTEPVTRVLASMVYALFALAVGGLFFLAVGIVVVVAVGVGTGAGYFAARRLRGGGRPPAESVGRPPAE